MNSCCNWWNIISAYGLLLLAKFTLQPKINYSLQTIVPSKHKISKNQVKPCSGLDCCMNQASLFKRFSLFFKCWNQMLADLSKYQMLISFSLNLHLKIWPLGQKKNVETLNMHFWYMGKIFILYKKIRWAGIEIIYKW